MTAIGRAILRFLVNIDLLIAGASLVAVVLLTVSGVFMRYAVNRPFSWTEEVQLILFVWMAFFGASAAFRLGGHVAIEVVVDLFPAKWRRLVEAFDSVLLAGLLGYLTYLEFLRGISLVRSGRTTNILQIPQYVTYFAVAAACALMLVNLIAWEARRLRSRQAEAADGRAPA